ncbi:MAG: cupin domain-containing protein [Pseudomonadota bacterium]
MDYPDFIQDLPSLDVPFPDDVARTHALRTDDALVVYFTVLKELVVPEHHHGAQWGHMFFGRLELTVDGETRVCTPGDSWDIPAGARHSAIVDAGSRFMDVFEEPDRYPLRAEP